MNKCPAELHSYICQLACSYDNHTVRALTLVSKYFRELASPFLYQCIAVSSPDQILALAAKLESTPPHMRHIRHLFLSDQSCDAEKTLQGTCPSGPEANSMFRILNLAAPTLETLAFVTSSQSTSTSLIARLYRMIFPRLLELTVFGYYPFPYTPGNMPHLQRLHLSGNRNPHGLLQTGALDDVCPSLTHLRVSGLNMAVSFSRELEDALKGEHPDTLPTSLLFPSKFPRHLRHLLVQFIPTSPSIHQKCGIYGTKERAVMKRLDAFSTKGEVNGLKFTMTEADVASQAIKREWADRLTGSVSFWAH